MFQEMSVFVLTQLCGKFSLLGFPEVVAWYLNWLPELGTLGYADPLPPLTSAIQATLIYIKEMEFPQICAGYGCGGNKYCGRGR